MRVLLITNGSKPMASPRTFIKARVPDLADRGKNAASLLLPTGVLKRILRGASLEKRFPVGLGYLSAVLKRDQHEVELVDRFVLPDAWSMRPINEYDFICVHVCTPFFYDSYNILARLEKERYTGPIAFGGPHTTLSPESIPPRVDYVVQGEAEYLIADLVAGKFPKGSLIRTPRIKNLDELPRADYDIFMGNRDAYDLTTPYAPTKHFFNMHTSRSCPFSCSFCSVREVWGKLWSSHSAERVVDDIASLKSTHGARGIYFREDLFTAQSDRVVAICEGLIRKGIDVDWACETRAEGMVQDPEMVKLMSRAGCRGFYIGAESGSDRMLEKYNKGLSSADIRRVCSLARNNGIKVAMSIIVADPDETFADRVATWRMVRDCKPQLLQLSAFNGEYTGVSYDYPIYEPRPVIRPDLPNSTWSGQVDRRAPSNVEVLTSDKMTRADSV